MIYGSISEVSISTDQVVKVSQHVGNTLAPFGMGGFAQLRQSC